MESRGSVKPGHSFLRVTCRGHVYSYREESGRSLATMNGIDPYSQDIQIKSVRGPIGKWAYLTNISGMRVEP